MIQLNRNLVHLLRMTLRKLVTGSFDAKEPILLTAQNGGLRLRAALPDVLVEFFQEGDFGQGEVAMRADQLKDWDAARVESLTLNTISSEKAQAEWLIDGIPQSTEWEPPDFHPEFPASPREYRVLPDNFLDALKEAVHCTSRDSVRFATNCVLLDGANQRIAATDGRQLLALGGWDFPWDGEVLLPALKVFSGNDLSGEPFEVGKTATHLTMRACRWTLHVPLDAGRRFPRIDQVIPKREEQKTTLVLDQSDSEFLVRTLPRLPGREEGREAVTLEMGREIIIRAKADNAEQATEIVLSRSRMEGNPLTISLNREMFARAIQLGFERYHMKSADTVVLAQDDARTYLWIPFAPALIVPAQASTRRIRPPSNGANVSRPVSSATPTTNGNGHAARNGNGNNNGHAPGGNGQASAPAPAAQNGNGHNRIAAVAVAPAKKRTRSLSPSGWAAVLEESVQLRDQARTLAAGLAQLIRTLKAQRKQNRLVESTLTSLKQIKGLV